MELICLTFHSVPIAIDLVCTLCYNFACTDIMK